jgi:hypothetical protein
MAKKNPSIDLKLIESLTEVIKEIGVKETTALLRDVKDPIQRVVNQLIKDILTQYAISKRAFYDKKVRGLRPAAFATLIFLTCKHFKLSYRELYYYINIEVKESRISQYITFINNLNPKLTCDIEIIRNNEIIEQKLVKNIEKSKQTNQI